ncbi:hypothetical protein GYH30_024647 [Glycine max]|uniref:Uncharacterized protein n=1 Tax=Glycine max TaxID=3847 RepID=K7LD35_SOYBN|nr:hypothetical protein GYH30_024647 [Glycine max]
MEFLSFYSDKEIVDCKCDMPNLCELQMFDYQWHNGFDFSIYLSL